MRHGKKILKIGREASHRKATLQSMSAALIEHKRIRTTLGKAQALRRYVEPVLTHAKDDSTAGRRQAFRRLQNKEAVKTLYNELAQAIGDRPGGYTRIVKLGQRGGDAAEMAIIELVDFNDVKPDGAAGTKRKTRRSRSKSTGETAAAPARKADTTPEPEATPEATPDEAAQSPDPDVPAQAESEEAPESQPAEAVATDAASPEAAGNVQVPPHGDDHPDAEQGAPTQTGEPGPGADATNMGRSHDAR